MLAIAQLSHNQREISSKVHWKQLMAPTLPPDVRDFSWLRGWSTLPTGDRIAAWGVAPTDKCPQCGQQATLEHAMYQCKVAKMYWIDKLLFVVDKYVVHFIALASP